MSEASAEAAMPNQDQGSQKDKNGFAAARGGIIFIDVVVLVFIAYLFLSGQIDAFLDAMAGVDVRWVLLGLLAYGVYYVFGVLAYLLPVAKDPATPLGIRDLMSVESAGLFFSNLTPNGLGGAPAQIVRLTAAGLSVGDAGAVQYTRFVVYEFAEALFAAIMLGLRLNYFLDLYGNLMFIGVVLFGFKVVEMTAILLVCLAPGIVTRVGEWFINFLVRHGWLREDHRGRWDDMAINEVQEFAKGFRKAFSHWQGMVATLVVTMLQLACLYSLSWFVIRAFHMDADFLTCMAAGSMLELLTSSIPLPGGTGGAEAGFAFMYAPLFGKDLAAGYVVWRAVEFFIPTALAAPLATLRSTDARDNVYAVCQRVRRIFSR